MQAECNSLSQGLNEKGQAIQDLREGFAEQVSALAAKAKTELVAEQRRHAEELAQANERLQR